MFEFHKHVLGDGMGKNKKFYLNAVSAGVLLTCATASVQADLYYDTNLQTGELFSPVKQSSQAAGKNADAYLDLWRQQNNNVSNQTEFRLQSVKTSLTAKHYYYQQYQQGVPVDKGGLSLSVSLSSGALLKAYSHLVNTKTLPVAKRSFGVSADKALNTAWRNLGVSGRLLSEPAIEKVWMPTAKGLIAVYRIALSVTEPLGDWYQYVDAESGEVLRLEQRSIFEKKHNGLDNNDYKPYHFAGKRQLATTTLDEALSDLRADRHASERRASRASMATGIGQVFDPDPATTLNDDTLTDSDAAERFADAYFLYPLPEVTLENGVYSLKSPWVEMSDLEAPDVAPATSDNGEWLFQRGEDGFDDTHVFYHIDANQRYIQSLGFSGETGIQYGPIRADANGLNGEDNSHYSPGPNYVAFGHGGVNDSEDADVVLHEYGHAINFSINNQWNGGDTGAMGEGFGDYWAGSYSLTTQNGDTFFPNRVFTWDGHNEFWGGRILNDLDAQYNPARNYPAHSVVDGVLGDQLWSTPLFQSLLTLIDAGYPREQADTIVLESQFGLGTGVTMRMLAQSVVQTAAELYPEGPHAGIYFNQFVAHNILEAQIKVDPLSVSAGGNAIITPGETVSLDIPLTSTGLAVTEVSGTITPPDTFEAIALDSVYADIPATGTAVNSTPFQFKVPDDTSCNTPFTVGFAYKGIINESVFSGTDEFEFLVGKKVIDSVVQDTPLSIPDNGAAVTSSLNIERPGTTVNNLKVRVDIEHTYIGDLDVTLHSPSGTPVQLHFRSGGGTDNLQVTYPDDVEPEDSLSLLDGEPISGKWTLSVQDHANLDVGQLLEWELIFENSVVCEE